MTVDEVTSKLAEELEPVPASPTESTTDIEIPDEIKRIVWRASYARLAEDLVLAVEIRRRDAQDTGERILLEDFIRDQGYDPADFGLE